MSSYLAYSYSSCLTEEEENKINERVSESQKEFIKGANTALMLYSIYSLTTSAANASDSCPSTDRAPSQANAPAPNNAVAKPKPGFKPVPEKHKVAAGTGALSICGAFFGSGDYLLGLGCVGMAFIMMKILNRE